MKDNLANSFYKFYVDVQSERGLHLPDKLLQLICLSRKGPKTSSFVLPATLKVPNKDIIGCLFNLSH